MYFTSIYLQKLTIHDSVCIAFKYSFGWLWKHTIENTNRTIGATRLHKHNCITSLSWKIHFDFLELDRENITFNFLAWIYFTHIALNISENFELKTKLYEWHERIETCDPNCFLEPKTIPMQVNVWVVMCMVN